MNERTASKQYKKFYYHNGEKHRLTVIAKLYKLGNNSRPHFSVTGSLDYQARNKRWVNTAAGCIHEDIVKVMPDLKSVVLVHLANDDGTPLHAYANASYWAGHTKYQDRNLSMLAKHLRINTDTAQDMCDHIAHFYGEFDSITTPTMAWQQTCEEYGLPELWKTQADTAFEILKKPKK